MASDCLSWLATEEQETILSRYLYSGEPPTTPNYPLNDYVGPVVIKEARFGGRGLFLTRSVETGDIVLISNSESSCIRYYRLQSTPMLTWGKTKSSEATQSDDVHEEYVSDHCEKDNRKVESDELLSEDQYKTINRLEKHREWEQCESGDEECDDSSAATEAGNTSEAEESHPDDECGGQDKCASKLSHDKSLMAATAKEVESSMEALEKLELVDASDTLTENKAIPELRTTSSGQGNRMADCSDQAATASNTPKAWADILCMLKSQPALPTYARVPPDVHEQLVEGLLSQISNIRKHKQILTLDDGTSCLSNDADNPPCLPVQFYEQDEVKLSRRELRKQKMGKQVIEEDGSELQMDGKDPRLKLKLWHIVANNATFDDVRSRSREHPKKIETCEFWGLWLLPSFINHSCEPNCNRFRVGSALVVRVCENLQAGIELTLPYFDIFKPLPMRKESADLWGFRCECFRCQFERTVLECDWPQRDLYASVQEVVRISQQTLHFALSHEPILEAVIHGLLTESSNVVAAIDETLAIDLVAHISSLQVEMDNPKTSDAQEPCPNRQQKPANEKEETPDKENHQPRSKAGPSKQKARSLNHRVGKDKVEEQQDRWETQEKSDPNNDEDKKLLAKKQRVAWMKASFVDVYIEYYALLNVYPHDLVTDEDTRTAENSGRVFAFHIASKKVVTLAKIMQIIHNVHGGDELGQEFCNNLLEAYDELLKSCAHEEVQTILKGRQRAWEYIVNYLLAYYGHQDYEEEGLLQALMLIR